MAMLSTGPTHKDSSCVVAWGFQTHKHARTQTCTHTHNNNAVSFLVIVGSLNATLPHSSLAPRHREDVMLITCRTLQQRRKSVVLNVAG